MIVNTSRMSARRVEPVFVQRCPVMGQEITGTNMNTVSFKLEERCFYFEGGRDLKQPAQRSDGVSMCNLL